MKKTISLILAVVTVFSCFGMSVFAEAPAPSASGFYVGKVLNVGDTFSSSLGAEVCVVTYKINADETANVTSEMGTKYASELPLTQFQDKIQSFTSSYGGIYTVKGYGEKVDYLMDNKGVFVSSNELDLGEDEDSSDDQITIAIDYKYTETTLFDYKSISGWKIAAVNKDNADGIDITLEAVWATREPTKFEAFGEALYTKYLVVRNALLDIFGNYMLQALPKFLATWAQFLKDITKA